MRESLVEGQEGTEMDPEKVPSEAERIRKTYREAERDLIGIEGVE